MASLGAGVVGIVGAGSELAATADASVEAAVSAAASAASSSRSRSARRSEPTGTTGAGTVSSIGGRWAGAAGLDDTFTRCGFLGGVDSRCRFAGGKRLLQLGAATIDGSLRGFLDPIGELVKTGAQTCEVLVHMIRDLRTRIMIWRHRVIVGHFGDSPLHMRSDSIGVGSPRLEAIGPGRNGA